MKARDFKSRLRIKIDGINMIHRRDRGYLCTVCNERDNNFERFVVDWQRAEPQKQDF